MKTMTQGYMVTRIQVAGILEYMNTGIHGYKDTGCRNT